MELSEIRQLSMPVRVYSEPEPAVMDCWAAGVVPTVVNIRRQSEAIDLDLLQPADPAAADDIDELRSVFTLRHHHHHHHNHQVA